MTSDERQVANLLHFFAHALCLLHRVALEMLRVLAIFSLFGFTYLFLLLRFLFVLLLGPALGFLSNPAFALLLGLVLHIHQSSSSALHTASSLTNRFYSSSALCASSSSLALNSASFSTLRYFHSLAAVSFHASPKTFSHFPA